MLRYGAVYGGWVQEETMPLAQLLAGFQSLPPLPTSKLVPSGADFQVGGFVYVTGGKHKAHGLNPALHLVLSSLAPCFYLGAAELLAPS